MSTIRKIFYVNTTDRAWYKIVVWWEIRRILYNAILILFGFFSYQLTSLLPDSGYFKLYAGPVLVVWTLAFLVLFFVFANICYTSGWIFQILTLTESYDFLRNIWHKECWWDTKMDILSYSTYLFLVISRPKRCFLMLNLCLFLIYLISDISAISRPKWRITDNL